MLLQPTLIIFASFWLTSWPRLFFLSIGYSPICPPCDNEMKTDAMLEHMCASEFGKCSSRPLASARRNLRRRRPHTHTHTHTHTHAPLWFALTCITTSPWNQSSIHQILHLQALKRSRPDRAASRTRFTPAIFSVKKSYMWGVFFFFFLRCLVQM